MSNVMDIRVRHSISYGYDYRRSATLKKKVIFVKAMFPTKVVCVAILIRTLELGKSSGIDLDKEANQSVHNMPFYSQCCHLRYCVHT